MASGNVTLADVARLAGVSEITVSRVVRNLGPISDKTRAAVQDAVATLGYVPNRAAGMLASSGSNLIAVLLPSLSNIVFPEVMRGINEGLKGTGFQPLIGVTDYDPHLEETLLASFLAWRPVAVITTGFDHTPATRRMLASDTIRVAELMDVDAPPIDVAVGLSHRSAGVATARHLVARGYRHFGYVGHNWDADTRARARHDGLAAGLAQAGLTIAAEVRSPGPSSTQAGKAALGALLATQTPLDVVVFSNDDMAVGGYFHCLGAGLRVRQDLALFGFNGLDIGQSLPARLSTLRSNRFAIGQRAVEVLLAHPTRPEHSQIIDTGFEIIAGDTA